MRKIGTKILTLLVAVFMLTTFAGSIVLATTVHVHTYTAATCTAAKTCTSCGTTSGSALGHSPVVSGTSIICSRCGKTLGSTSTGSSTSEEVPATHTHSYEPATCTEPKTCSKCGATSGNALGHNYKPATCTAPKTCSRCGITSGSALGHSYVLHHDELEHWKTCSRCGKEMGRENHIYDATNTCIVCEYYKGIELPEIVKNVEVRYNGSILAEKVRTTVETEDSVYLYATPSSRVEKLYYLWDNENESSVRASNCEIIVPEDFADGSYHTLYVCAEYDDGKITDWQVYYFKIYADNIEEEEDDDDDELIIEPWMKEEDELSGLAVSLRNDSEETKSNRNVYAIDEEVIYYVDYKNGGKDISSKVTVVLNLPLKFKVVSSDGGSISSSNKTITWTFSKGLDKEESGTKTVVLKYTTLGSSKLAYKIVKPVVDMKNGTKLVDSSAVINLIYKDAETEIEDLHVPYMYGDKNATTFRPDATITRAEGALVLTRVFGISTAYDTNSYSYPDLNETYEEARKAIVAATAYGIINGYTDGYYRPNQSMTRAEFMKIIASRIEIENEDDRGFEIKTVEDSIKVYKDPNRSYVVGNNYVSDHWALEEVTLLTRLNMTSASTDKNLRLDEPITRAEVAQLVNYYLLRAPAKVTSRTTTQFSDVNRYHKLFADVVEATREMHAYTLTEKGTEIAEY